MTIDRDAFTRLALDCGAADVSFTGIQPFLRWADDTPAALAGVNEGRNLRHDPIELLPDAKSIIVLFFEAAPFLESDSPFARYYVQSHRGYNIAHGLAEALCSEGICAVHPTRLPHRAAAMRSGGKIGKNGLYVHPKLGSFVHIELIVNNAFEPYDDGVLDNCAGCGRCVEACPTGALRVNGRTMADCLRNHLYRDDMPEPMREHVFELLGCEVCQRVCPNNAHIQPIPIEEEQREALDFARILHGDLDAADKTIGRNLAKWKQLAGQTILFIGALRKKEYKDCLRELKRQNTDAPYIDWAIRRLD